MNGTMLNDRILDAVDETDDGIYGIPSYVQEQIRSQSPTRDEDYSGPRSKEFLFLLQQQPEVNKWAQRKKN